MQATVNGREGPATTPPANDRPPVAPAEHGPADAGPSLDPQELAGQALRPLPPARSAGSLDSWASSAEADSSGVVRLLRRWPAEGTEFVPLPEVGSRFLGFQLIAELGRGTFGRVYLARQGDLADRLVALKVSTESLAESQKLAQLQHTHIVPVYSLHQAGPLQAACMPYLGSTTLADVLHDLGRLDSLPASGKGLISTLQGRRSRTQAAAQGVGSREVGSREEAAAPAPPTPYSLLPTPSSLLRRLEGLTYVEAVLWIGSCLADGLAHAHERGILHRDIKPANVLLTDDGQPMLLDFNLADDTKQQRRADQQGPAGGTLPYMAPEHLAAFAGLPAPFAFTPAGVDARSDLYALGVILHELLTGCHPFVRHPGPPESAVPRMIADRLEPPAKRPAVRPFNPAVSPAVESIVRHCLEPDPSRRYQSARQLLEDLQRQLTHRPLAHAKEPSPAERLRKWARRHPRLASSGGVAALAGALLVALSVALFAGGRRASRLEAQARYEAFQEDLRSARMLLTAHHDEALWREGQGVARRALGRFGVLDSSVPAWREQQQVLLLRDEQRERLAGDVGELLLLLASTTPDESALPLVELAESCFPRQAPRAVWVHRANLHQRLGQAEEARPFEERARTAEASGSRDLYLLAVEHERNGEYPRAVELLQRVVDDDPENFAAWFLLGNCCLESFTDQGAWAGRAVGHFTACLALRPGFYAAWYSRGLAHHRLGQFKEAEADFTRALALREGFAPALVGRAAARKEQKKYREALGDLDAALVWGGSPTRVLLVRARVKEALGDAEGAGADRSQALKQTPTDAEGWVARGVERARNADPEGALADFDRALKLSPRTIAGWQNRASVLSEQLGRTREAVAALDGLLKLHPGYVPARSSRGVLLARLGRRDEAVKDAEAALRRAGEHAEVQFQVAGVYALCSRTHPADKETALGLLGQALLRGFGHDLLERDPDLAPLRQDARFRALVRAAQTVSREAKIRKP